MIDTRVSLAVVVIAIVCCLFPFLPQLIAPEFISIAVRSVENIQALILFSIFVFTLVYMQPWNMPNGQKHFWLWAACWWLLLCGRSTSWGRDYFPDVPKGYFRAISVVLIGSVVFMLFSKHLRLEIAQKSKSLCLPIWAMFLAVIGLVISDSIENLRAIHVWFVFDLKYQNLIEELYEFPLIFGLYLIAWSFMVKDAKNNANNVTDLQVDYKEARHRQS